ncbi:hypothetical protein G6011_02132 [Alternaria panax]|uniref:Uncharacterized protein n=1 Tax=Alternaria panax TaxID=48097 RepID=A0AAD4FIJ8_9PLEO|nr:hypothetical protein G6011_02132 [Alternaria panax]
MAAFLPHSQSPRLSQRESLRMHAGNPTTPVHSPHHSVTSSASSRTPVHVLTIHEYRKQQHTPTLSQTGTPLGKTLRRKPAALALNDIERAPSVSHSARSGSGPPLRPLHFSQSAYQLNSDHPPFQQQTLLELAHRSQSAEPRVQTGSISSILTGNSSGKVRQFKPRKRLPKPQVAAGPVLFPPSLANVKSTQPRQSPPPMISSFPAERSHSSGAHTTPTASTLSLSRFPYPPHQIDPSLSPPHDERESAHVDAPGFATTAPATPPATPAIIHYRGASFDLVNPHDSLRLHDIVTPSRDFDSSEFLSLRSSGDAFSEMAPKRAVYGDLRAAHAGILRRPEDSPNQSHMDLPLAPSPATVSPNSSLYTSPLYSPESVNAPSPLALKAPARESRFSFKGLTRSLTKKLSKSPAVLKGEELQDMRNQNVSVASISMDGDFPRPLNLTYVTTPETSYFPVGPISLATPTSPMSPESFHAFSPGQKDIEISRRHPTEHYDTVPLASMLPDDYSTQIGRIDDSQLPYSTEGGFSKPYYDDLDSIYPSSSIYTADGHRQSTHQQGLSSNRNSSANPFAHYSGMEASDFADTYDRNSFYDYSVPNRVSRRVSRPFAQDMYHPPIEEGGPKTDTISKLIDEYSPQNAIDTALATHYEDVGKLRDTHHSSAGVPSRRPPITQHPGSPPREAAPLAPAFEYDEVPFVPPRLGLSSMFSHDSNHSYGDTRNLLRISHSEISVQPDAVRTLEPSSSYSQPQKRLLEPSSSYSQVDSPQSPHTPKEALDQAEQIFQDTIDKHQNDSTIPVMWGRRNSASLLLSKTATNSSSGAPKDFDALLRGDAGPVSGDKADWETVGGNSPDSKRHESLSSIADYSSSEGTRNSIGLNSEGSLPSWAKQAQSPPRSSYYSHPSPVRSQHPHPFTSSPPQLRAQASVRTAPDTSSPPLATSPPASRTAPLFRFSSHAEGYLGRGAVEQPYAYAPWADLYAFSDKETQELLASGPNDNIIINEPRVPPKNPARQHHRYRSDDIVPTSSTADESVFDSSPIGLRRQNTFEKLSVVGPKGNLTGTPRGTGMHETGSSVADHSSPGGRLSSSVGRQSFRSDYNNFYASPFPATGSVTRISQSRPTSILASDRTLSEISLSPQTKELETLHETYPLPGARKHLRNSTTFLHSQRRTSRSAVPGQTKLRQMFLAPEAARSTVSTQSTHARHLTVGSNRPSTSDTNTPLRPSYPSLDIYPTTAHTNVAHEHSPHLLCVERESNLEDEARRRKLSWFIFAAFCLLPPCILLFRFLGDDIIASLTEGHLGYCTPESKRMALIAGIAVNVGLVTAILVPILIAHALNAV